MTQSSQHRPIRSYVRRQGRLTSRQREALADKKDHFVLACEPIVTWEMIFARTAPTVLEIGFGMGHVLLDMARRCPDKNFIGIDIYQPGIGSVLAQLAQEGLNNVRLFCADVVDVLPCLPAEALEEIFILFPDPWPKNRHHKRRLVQPGFIKALMQKLQENGYIHLATDWEDYALHMQHTLEQIEGAVEASAEQGGRVITKYEQRGQRLGHKVWDFVYMKNTRTKE